MFLVGASYSTDETTCPYLRISKNAKNLGKPSKKWTSNNLEMHM